MAVDLSNNPGSRTLLQTTTTTATGSSFERTPVGRSRAFQSVLTCTSGNCSGTVIFEASLDGDNFVTMATVTFAAAASPQSDGFVSDAPWLFVRTRVTAITGTGASISNYLAQ
jgi:hypothetical protein